MPVASSTMNDTELQLEVPPARKGSGGATPSAALLLLDVPLARLRRHALHPAWRRSERTRFRYSDRL